MYDMDAFTSIDVKACVCMCGGIHILHRMS